MRRKHVDHFIETLEVCDLAKHFTLLQLTDANNFDKRLRTYPRIKV